MEVAVIDWNDSTFVKDDHLENINAPQWVDFTAPDESVDDEAWFCRSDCNHPKTIDDFLKVTPTSKLQRSATVSEMIPFGDRSRREVALKKRGLLQPLVTLNKESKSDKFEEDGENQNPNLSIPPNQKAKLCKEAIKSSTEKRKEDESLLLPKEERPKLKSTLSARNLFAGKDILNHITDFCTELKRMAMRAKEREKGEQENAKKSPVAAKKQEVNLGNSNSGVLDERKPLLEASKEKFEAREKSNVKEKLRRKIRNDEAENTPIRVDLKNIGRKDEILSQIRTCPPSPQCFSANRGATKSPTPKALRARPQERGILQEMEPGNKDVRKEVPEEKTKATNGRNVPIAAAEGEARSLDMFWFLKPCTLAS